MLVFFTNIEVIQELQVKNNCNCENLQIAKGSRFRKPFYYTQNHDKLSAVFLLTDFQHYITFFPSRFYISVSSYYLIHLKSLVNNCL
jgi:hypothetical protein